MAEEKKTIFLVEDELLLLNLLKQRLERAGFEVVTAKDGEEALNVLKSISPDLILLDIILPKVSGFEFMEQVRSDPAYKKTPILILSNLGQDNDIKKGETLGASGYLIKARLSIEEVVKKVKEFMAKV